MIRRSIFALLTLLIVTAAPAARAFDWIGKIELDAEGLRDSDPSRRRTAIQKLSTYDIEVVKPYLLSALRDTDWRVRAAAGRLLGRHKVAEAAPLVVEWLNDPDRDTKQTAAEILAEIGGEEAVAALIRTLGDLDFNVRLRAIAALAKIGTPAVVVPLIGRIEDEKNEVRLAAVEALRALGDRRAMIPLVGAFADANVKVRVAAVAAVGNLGDQAAVPALLRLLDDSVENIRVAAVTSLGNLAAAEATEVLVNNLSKGSPAFKAKVAYALGQIAKAPTTSPADATVAVTALVKALADSQQRVAVEALRNAGAVAVPALVAHLEGRLEGDPDTAVILLRDIADPRATPALIAELTRGRVSHELLLDALSKSGDEAALIPILGLLSDPEASVRMHAMRALQPLLANPKVATGQASDVLVGLLDDNDFEIQILAIDYIGLLRAPNAVAKLLSLAGPGNKLRLRSAAIAALGQIADPAAGQLLLDTLSKGPERLQPVAANALIYIGDEASVDRLIAMAETRDLRAREQAVRVLGGVLRDRRHKRARKLLVELASDARLTLSLAAVASLGAMGDPAAVAPLLDQARSYNPHRRRAAVEALGNIGSRDATGVLMTALQTSDDRVASSAAWALAKIADPTSYAALVRAARYRSWATAINATAALARTNAGTLEQLTPLLHHRIRFVRANAATALGRRKAKSATRALIALLATDPSRLVRRAAARALGQIGAAGGEVAEPLGVAAESDGDDKVRAAARAALEAPFVAPKRSDWRNFYFVDPDNGDAPVREEPYFVAAADGLVTALYTDERGQAAEEQFPPGDFDIAPKSKASEY